MVVNLADRPQLPIKDDPSFDIRPYFDESAAFIDDAVRHSSRILVHCVAGVSRSATLVLAWMMLRKKFRLKQAIKHVRGIAVVNP